MTRKKPIEASGPVGLTSCPAPDAEASEAAMLGQVVSDRVSAVAPPPGDHQYPTADVLRNHGTAEFTCRRTGLLLPPGASRLVTIRDSGHHALLLDVIDQFNRAQLRAGLLKFDRLHG